MAIYLGSIGGYYWWEGSSINFCDGGGGGGGGGGKVDMDTCSMHVATPHMSKRNELKYLQAKFYL